MNKRPSRFPIDHFLNIPQGSSAKTHPSQAEHKTQLSSQPDLARTNQEIKLYLASQIDQTKYQSFFDDTFSLVSLTANTIKFAVTTEYIKTIIKQAYLSHIQKAVKQVLGKPYEIKLSVVQSDSEPNISRDKPLSDNNSRPSTKKTSAKDVSFSINTDLVLTKDDKLSSINSQVINNHTSHNKFKFIVDPKKTFNNFIAGPSNNMAYASAQAVAKAPGETYPCLYFHSRPGLGKTHLLHAVANNIKKNLPSLIICIATAQDFMTEMVNAITQNNIFAFRKKYSEEVDVLMIDDVHELKNKERTQSEFFHLFNELHNRGKQLIFTSDKPPKDINDVAERIKTRLAWGLVIDIQPPDLETRIAILKCKADEEDIFVPQDVLNLVASRVSSNIRELEGSLIRLAAYSSVFGVDIDMEIAREQLNLNDKNNPGQGLISLEQVAQTTAQYLRVPLADMRSKSRLKTVAHARHIAMYLSHNLIHPAPTYADIGSYFGGRDHTSVLHAVEKIRKTTLTNQSLSQILLEIENQLFQS